MCLKGFVDAHGEAGHNQSADKVYQSPRLAPFGLASRALYPRKMWLAQASVATEN
jgi:hypothetical protein